MSAMIETKVARSDPNSKVRSGSGGTRQQRFINSNRSNLGLVEDRYSQATSRSRIQCQENDRRTDSSPYSSIQTVSLVVSGLLLALLGVFFVGARNSQATPGLVANTLYTVRPGDTIWSIASRFAGNGDVSHLEYRIYNQLGTTSLVAGEKFVLSN